MGGIFISYRREDGLAVNALYHNLVHRYGEKNVMMDVYGIPFGVDFIEFLKSEIAKCTVFLPVIGTNWMSKDEEGRLRIEDDGDFVRVEIEKALECGGEIIPILIDCDPPPLSELPDSVKDLFEREIFRVSTRSFRSGVEIIYKRLDDLVNDLKSSPNSSRIDLRNEKVQKVAEALQARDGVAEAKQDEDHRYLFVSHVTEDSETAMSIVEQIERRGVACWIAPRDIDPGASYDDEIGDAIDNCRAMLLIFSELCNTSEYIRREVTVAGEAKKLIIPFRIENVLPKKGLRLRLSDLHWIDAYNQRENAIDVLVKAATTRSR